MKRLFISKENSEIHKYIEDLHNKDFEVISFSFLKFAAIYASIQKSFQVIFFSSPRSVIFYLGQHQVPSGTALACSGQHTAEILTAMGHKADFVGEKSGDMKLVANELKSWCGNRNILFPVSNRSLGTVSNIFAPTKKEMLQVYETQLQSHKVSECTHYVFTSPSNVEGFLLENSLPEICTVIAWGKSTKNAIEAAGLKVDITLENGSMKELLEVLF